MFGSDGPPRQFVGAVADGGLVPREPWRFHGAARPRSTEDWSSARWQESLQSRGLSAFHRENRSCPPCHRCASLEATVACVSTTPGLRINGPRRSIRVAARATLSRDSATHLPGFAATPALRGRKSGRLIVSGPTIFN